MALRLSSLRLRSFNQTMPTPFSHPAIPLAMALCSRRCTVSKRLLLGGVIVSVLPDLDVLAFRFGIPYAAEWGHRGFSHSLLLALLIGLLGAALAGFLKASPKRAFGFLSLSAASHGVLDAFTNGGLGIALLWPFSTQRFFAPVQPIQVAPLTLSRFFSQRGWEVIVSELQWIWLPCLMLVTMVWLVRKLRASEKAE